MGERRSEQADSEKLQSEEEKLTEHARSAGNEKGMAAGSGQHRYLGDL